MNKPNFSVVVISRNEEKTLPRLLKSLDHFKEAGGQVVIIDTGSSDKTAKIARDWGCKVDEVGDTFRRFIHKKEAEEINRLFIVDEEPIVEEGDTLFDFTSARNYAAGLADNDWVCMPDCDEIFTAFDLDALNTFTSDPNIHRLEYDFVYAHNSDGSPSVAFTHSKFYNKKCFEWTGIIHEVLKDTKRSGGNNKSIYIDPTCIKLEHYQNHETNRGGYLKGLALDVYEHAENDRNSHYFGRELMYTGRPKSAIKEFDRHIAMEKWPTERAQSMIFKGDCYMRLGDTDKAIEAYLNSFALEGGRREALLRLAATYLEKEDYQNVIKYCEQAINISWSSYYANIASHYKEAPHELLYIAYYWLKDLENSKKHFDIAMNFAPLKPKILHDYRFYYKLPKVSVIIPTLGRPAGLKKCKDSIKKLVYPQELIEVLVYDGEGTVPNKVAQGVSEATGEVYVYAANDMEFTPESLILAVIASKDKGLVAFHEGDIYPDEGNICTHFLITKELTEKLGGIFDTRIFHTGCDNLLWAKSKKLGQAIHLNNAWIIHNHFSKGAEFDEVYKIGWNEEKRAHDLEILKQELIKLETEV